MKWFDQSQQSGYGIIPGMLNDADTRNLLNELSATELPRSRAGIRHIMSLSAVSRIAHSESVLSAVQLILGKDSIPFRATFFDKSPSSNWLVMWHQDTALPLVERKQMDGWGPWSVKDGVIYAHAPANALEQVLAVRLHLDDSNPNNGPLRILPGTHLDGVLTDEKMHQLSETVDSVECTVPKGGAVLMRPLVIHASSKSTSEEPRRVIHMEFAATREILPYVTLAIA